MEGVPDAGLGAVGIGGFPGIFGAPGFAPTGGGLGFAAMGGGTLFKELFGREPAGLDPPESPPLACAFFHGAAEPFAGPIPGNTDTGLEEEFAATDFNADALGVVEVEAPPDVGGAGGLLPAGGGGGGAGAAFGLCGTSSR